MGDRTHEGRFAGDCGPTIQYVDDEPHVEVGYRVHPDPALVFGADLTGPR